MKFSKRAILFQEVPGETSLTFYITGCPIKCKHCHSKEWWDGTLWEELTEDLLIKLLEKYEKHITCVLFFWGEWEKEKLINLFKIIKKRTTLKICLYTGLTKIDPQIKSYLDYLKVGPFILKKGGLNDKNTNQKFLDVKNKKDLTFKFWK